MTHISDGTYPLVLHPRIRELLGLCEDGFGLSFAAATVQTDAYAYAPDKAKLYKFGLAKKLETRADAALRRGEIGRMLGEMAADEAFMAGLSSPERALVRQLHRVYRRRMAVPAKLVERLNEAAGRAGGAYGPAKHSGDFLAFRPHLEALIPLVCEKAKHLAEAEGHDDLYGALMGELEPGMTTLRLQEVIGFVGPPIVALAKTIAEKGMRKPDVIARHAPYGPVAQRRLCEQLMDFLLYDKGRGSRLATVVHPFTETVGPFDTRVTTYSWMADNFLPCLMGTAHECGHAGSHQGTDDAFQHIALEGMPFGLNESQSRTYENLVCRSREFWTHFFPVLQETFPQLKRVTLDEFFLAVNWVEPSLIRMEADEVTYNLHIMIRAEIEMGLLSGEIKVEDLPEAWNAKYREYLGITPPNHTVGVLQDVHWSMGYFGYFPAYMLGNLYGPPIFEAMKRAVPDAMHQIATGNFGPARRWLRENVHRFGLLYTSEEVVRDVAGGVDLGVAIRYLQAKYWKLYDLIPSAC